VGIVLQSAKDAGKETEEVKDYRKDGTKEKEKRKEKFCNDC
jgi:hypothetical protein